MLNWDPAAHEEFRPWREQPFHDLVAVLPEREYLAVLDAGCGTGRTTRLLAERFPRAIVLGVDRSPEMLQQAPAHPRVHFRQADLAAWTPPFPFDLVVANAVLHWIPDPELALRRLASWVTPTGILAVQVPANFGAPSHRLVREVAGAPAWSGLLRDVAAGDHVLEPEAYVRVLGGLGFRVRSWDVVYAMQLQGDSPVLRWLEGTTLRPYLDHLGDEAPRFMEDLGARLREAYPATDGVVTFPFRRRFVVAEGELQRPSPMP